MSSHATDYAHCVCAYPATPACKCVRPGWHIEQGPNGLDIRCFDPECEDPAHVEDVDE